MSNEADAAGPSAPEQQEKPQARISFATCRRIGDARPEMLLIDGRNPLTLLHAALSEGLHALTDECMALTRSIRVVLTEMSVRMRQALKEDKELQDAVAVLLNVKKPAKN
jgi:hypothetical protein